MEPVVPPPPSGSGLSAGYGPGVTEGLNFLESFGNVCLHGVCRHCITARSPHPLSELRAEVSAPAGSGLASQHVVDTRETDPSARTLASHAPPPLRVCPWVPGDNEIAQCNTGSHPGHTAAASGKTPDKVVHQNPPLGTAGTTAKDTAVSAVGVALENGPVPDGHARSDDFKSISHNGNNIQPADVKSNIASAEKNPLLMGGRSRSPP